MPSGPPTGSTALGNEAIREGFSRLRPGSAYDDLGQAARARAQADWLVGMNLTRAYTVHNKVLCTIGRVQTPTLAMIVGRDAQIASFRKAFFYELVATLEEGFSAKYSQGPDAHRRQGRGRAAAPGAQPHRTGTVRKIEKKIRRNRPPPLYDLTSLAAGRQPALRLHRRPGTGVRPGPLRDPQADQLPAHREPPHRRGHGAAAARHPGKAGSPAGACGIGTAPWRAPAGQGLRRQAPS